MNWIKKLNLAHCDHWATRGCCYASDNGSSCDRDLLLSDLSTIYQEWYAAGQWCDRSDGVLVEVCDEDTEAETDVTEADESCQEVCKPVPSVTNKQACADMRWYCNSPKAESLYKAGK